MNCSLNKSHIVLIMLVILSLFCYFTIERRSQVHLLLTSRTLSAEFDLITGESLKTFNGKVPEISCPLGHYRPPGSTDTKRVSAQRQDGCKRCPRGRYGDSTGLLVATCTAACPVGTYGDQEGLKSASECQKCPPGSFGIYRGMKTKECSGLCPRGRYSDSFGAASCKVCPPHYHDWQCGKDINS